MFELLVDRVLKDGRFVILNNSNADVPRGTIFTSLQSRLATRSDGAFQSTPISPAEAVELELQEIEWFRRSIDQIPRGHNAAVVFKGSGVEQLLRHLSGKQKSVQVFLSTHRAEA